MSATTWCNILYTLAGVAELAAATFVGLDLRAAKQRAADFRARPNIVDLSATIRAGSTVTATLSGGQVPDIEERTRLLEQRLSALEEDTRRQMRETLDEVDRRVERRVMTAEERAHDREGAIVELLEALGSRWRSWVGLGLLMLSLAAGTTANFISANKA